MSRIKDWAVVVFVLSLFAAMFVVVTAGKATLRLLKALGYEFFLPTLLKELDKELKEGADLPRERKKSFGF